MKFTLQNIPIAKLTGNNLARSNRPTQRAEVLKRSIAQFGILQPVLLLKKGDKYVLVAGFGRVQAAKELELLEVPAQVFEGEIDILDLLVMAFNENTVRTNLAFLDQADAIERLVKGKKISEGEAGELLGLSQSVTSKILSSQARLTDNVKLLITQHKIGYAIAYTLSKAPPDKQEELLRRFIDEKWSRERLEKEVKGKPSLSFCFDAGDVLFTVKHVNGNYETLKLSLRKFHDALARCEKQQVPFNVLPKMLEVQS